ncbi:MAG: glycosyltransferase [Verrucomicrobiales bacterium]|nr:glycosyltransferase family 1 protein [Nitrospinaceae bacterium]
MKILHAIDSGGLYGAEVMLLSLVGAQIKLGLDPTICSIGEKNISEKPLESEALKRGFKLKKFRMRPGPNVFGALRILQFARREHFDVIHSHGYKTNIFFGFTPKKLRKIPWIATLHGWTNQSLLTKMRVYEWLDAKSLKFSDAVILVSEMLLSNPKLKHKSLNNLSIVSNGIPPLDEKEPIRHDRRVADFCRQGFIIGTIGRLSPEKGFKYLIKAIASLKTSIPEIKLVILGEGAERNSLEKLVAELGLKKNILFAGYKSNGRSYLSLFSLFVLPSLTEGLPIAILEAMLSSTPVVATRVGGIPDVLEGGEAGVLVKPGDSQALISAILSRYSDIGKEHVKNSTKRAKELVERYYTSDKMALKYCKIYQSVQQCL